MRSNCLVYAVSQYLRHGGYVIMMHSRFGWWPHFVWSPDMLTFWEFAPPRKRPRRFPSLWFQGSVKEFSNPLRNAPR